MDIKEYTSAIRNAKAELEDEMLSLLREFQFETGLAVTDVHVRTVREIGDGLIITEVGVEVFI